MPATFHISVKWPDLALSKKDQREAFKRSVLPVMMREMQAIADEAATLVHPFSPMTAEGYVVKDASSGATVAVEATNTHPNAIWTEVDTRPHWPPWGPGTSLAHWADAHGIEPFLVARKISRVGTKGHHFLEQAVERRRDAFLRGLEQAVQDYLDTLGGK